MAEQPTVEELQAKIREMREQAQAQTRLLEERLHLLSGVFDNTIEGIIITGKNGIIKMVNPGFTAISGYSAEEAVGKTPRILKSGRHDQAFYKEMWSSLLNAGRWQGEIWNRRKCGTAYVERLSISAIRDPMGQITHFVAVFHDISDIKKREAKYKYRSLHDPLTGLPNRQLLEDRMERAIAAAKRNKKRLAVLFVDLDGFKGVNDEHGHHAGDIVLQEVAKRLKQACREEDTVCRLGGDEFLLILPDLTGGERFIVSAAERIIRALSPPVEAEGVSHEVHASIGISVYPEDGLDGPALIANADKAMYEAKKKNRGGYNLYNPLAKE